MEERNDCPMDRDYLIAKSHGMTAKEFYSMPDKQKYDVYCKDCKNWDCYAKRKFNK